MQISSVVYMGVETLVRLAAQREDRPCTTLGLAEWINQSVSYTETLMARLCGAGLVKARHGSVGGYYLARPAQRITVADVFRVFDEPHDLPNRPIDAVAPEPVAIQNLDGTDLLWEAFKSHILLFLNEISLADITLADITLNSAGERGGGEANPPPAWSCTCSQSAH